MDKEEIKCECCVDYQSEYFRQLEQIKFLTNENEKIKKALLNICLKLGK